jgi:hypothetical protein
MMNKLGRKEFFGRTVLALAGAAVVPRLSLGKAILSGFPEGQRRFPARGKEAINDLGIIDLHCHPSLKMYLWDKKIWKHSSTSPGMNFDSMQYTIDK